MVGVVTIARAILVVVHGLLVASDDWKLNDLVPWSRYVTEGQSTARKWQKVGELRCHATDIATLHPLRPHTLVKLRTEHLDIGVSEGEVSGNEVHGNASKPLTSSTTV